MGNRDELHNPPAKGRSFWIFTGLLFLAAVAVRWFRLEWMFFLLDQSAICERAALVRAGELPLTGIVNSMGFRNAPGYVWMLMPVFFFTTNAVVAAAWHGLVSASMVIPLALAGRRYRRDALMWLPAVIAAVFPYFIFAGRNLWAQNMVLPFAAWALWALDESLDETASMKRRATMAAVCLGLIAWSISIHYGVVPVLIAAGIAMFPLLRQLGGWQSVKVLLPAALIFLTMVPSVVDYAHVRHNPTADPEYAIRMQEARGEGLPMWARFGMTAEVALLSRSLHAVPGLLYVFSDGVISLVQGFDVFVSGLIVAGLGTGLYYRFKRRDPKAPVGKQAFYDALLLWLIVPMLVSAIVLKQLNPGYFNALLPAGWLMTLFLPALPDHRWWRKLAGMIVGFVVIGSLVIYGLMLSTIVNSKRVIRGYAAPYKKQTEVVRHVLERGILPENIEHLSGPVFSAPYRYIARDLLGRGKVTVDKPSDMAALIREKDGLIAFPYRRQFLLDYGAVEVGMLYVLEIPSENVSGFVRRYMALSDDGWPY